MAGIIDLMLATGSRIGEILAWRWSDLDLWRPTHFSRCRADPDLDRKGHVLRANHPRARLAAAWSRLKPVTRDRYIAKPPVSGDLSEVLERLPESDDECGFGGREIIYDW